MRIATLVLCASLVLATNVRGASVTLLPTLDTTIYAEDSTLSNGSGEYVFAGSNAGAFPRRALMRFNVAAFLPAGATIDSVALTLVMTQTSAGSGPRTVSLHTLLADWGEGTSNAPGNEGGGAPATAGDATWFWQDFLVTPWSTPGGNYTPAASASTVVNTIATYTWTSTGLRDDVQAWLDTPSTDLGWMLIGDESAAATAKRFDGRQRTVPGTEPRLDIFYTGPPTGASPLASRARLLPAVPNPFNPTTRVRFELADTGDARVSIVDARGRVVRTLHSGRTQAGINEVVWRGESDRGGRVASGVFFVRLEVAGQPVGAQKLVLIK